jgi:hypothetical protein
MGQPMIGLFIPNSNIIVTKEVNHNLDHLVSEELDKRLKNKIHKDQHLHRKHFKAQEGIKRIKKYKNNPKIIHF